MVENENIIIVGINGSPNSNGNTHKLLEASLEYINDYGVHTELINVGEILKDTKQLFCNNCSYPCSGECYRETKIESAFNIISKADGIILGSPVSFGNISIPLHIFFEKTRKFRKEKMLYNKIGAGIAVGASKFGGQEFVLNGLYEIMMQHGMIIVGDSYYEDNCGHFGVCAQNSYNKIDEDASKRIKILSKRMVEVCKGTQVIR